MVCTKNQFFSMDHVSWDPVIRFGQFWYHSNHLTEMIRMIPKSSKLDRRVMRYTIHGNRFDHRKHLISLDPVIQFGWFLAPLDSSQWDNSNDTKIIQIGSQDHEIHNPTKIYLISKNNKYIVYLRILWSNSANFGTVLVLLESSQWDDSNDTKIIQIGS